MNTLTRRIVIAASLLIGSLLILFLALPGARPGPQEETPVAGMAAIGGPFVLTDQHGNSVTEEVLKGHYSLIYFGFTYCPDVCPLTLQHMTDALQMAGPVAEDVLPVFISIDPDRDTPEIMGTYVSNFHPRFLALTGTAEQVRAAAGAWRVYYAKSPLKDADGNPTDDYTMNHSGYTFLMDADGHYVTHFGADATAQAMAARLRQELSPR